MLEAPTGSAVRQSVVFDLVYTVGLLAIAITTGYAVLLPHPGAHIAAVRPPAAVVGAVRAHNVAMQVEPAHSAARESHAATPAAVPKADAVVARATPDAVKPVPWFSRPSPGARPPAVPDRPRGSWSGPVSGRVLDADGQPITGASVAAGGVETRVGDDGTFTVTPPSDATLIVKRPGFAKVTIEPTPTRGALEIVMKPQSIKAAYLTYFGFGDRGIRNRVLDLVDRTELNAVVIDVKGDRGWIIYQTKVDQAVAIGAQGPGTLRDFDSMMAELKARNVYTIARIVTFKDNILANARPDLAITDTRTGKPWIDRENLAWVDPFREEVWNYNIALAKEAIERGFDEVQFDYVRFPTDGKLAAAKYSKTVNKETRLPTVAAFLERARKELGARGAYVAADLFGYTAFNENDTDIGQRIEELAPHLDYICPMVYPSGYHVGIPGFRNPVENSYAVVRESVRLIRKRAAHTPARVRPWLQDFKDYAFDRRIFGVTEIRDQIRGADEAGGSGWMLWNPRNDYTGAALRNKSLAAR